MPRAVQAAVCAGGGAPPVIEDLLLDDPAADELVIKVEAAGICHTDLGIAKWSDSPRVFGHEGAGTVVAIGEKVTRFSPGDRVVATFGFCGACATCSDGHPAHCMDGIALNIEGQRAAGRPSLTRPDGTAIGGAFFQQSCFATHALVTERNVVALPEDMDFVTAAPLGCGIQTGAGAVFNQLGAGKGAPIVIIGCGAVGLAAIMAAKIRGCEPIVAVDILPERLAIARGMGAHHAIAPGDDLVARLRDFTGGGAAAVLDSAGKQETFESAIHALRPGGRLGVLTLPGAFGDPIPHPGGLAFLTTSIIGIIEGDGVPDETIPRLIAYQQAGELPYERLIETFAFADIARAFTAAAQGTAIKPVLTFGS